MTAEIVWTFDGTDGHCQIMAALVRRQIESLERVLPGEFSDPLQQLAAEISSEAEAVVEANPMLGRLFPPALQDEEQASQFRRDAMVQQARSRLAAARVVLNAVADVSDCSVDVRSRDIDSWVMTLAGLRAQWNVELTGSAERLAQPTHRDMLQNPTAAAITDWLGYLIEDALAARYRYEEQP